jgi:CRISPR-associated protein Cas5d
VEYYLEAVIEVLPEHRQRGGHPVHPTAEFLARNKYHQMFLRRARSGQCYYQPFFGCREFSVAEWELVESPPDKINNQPEREDFGMIFHDFNFEKMWNRWQPNDEQKKELHPIVPRPDKGWNQPGSRPAPKHFHAIAENGWITLSKEAQA